MAKLTKPNPPDYIINPAYPCSCDIKIEGKNLTIKYCPLHAAAPKLFVALRDTMRLIDFASDEYTDALEVIREIEG